MEVTILLHARCPVCGYRSQGVRVSTARPRMRDLRLGPGVGWCPRVCDECGHPLDYQLYDRWALDEASAGKLQAWRARQRARQRDRRKRAVA